MLTLIIGYPNAGKTTYSARYNNVVHFDDYNSNRPEGLAIVSKIPSVCVEGLFLTRRSREEILAGRKSPNICVWIDTPLEECCHRVGRSARIVQTCAKKFVPPTLDEGWDEIIIVKPDGSETRITEVVN